MHTCTPAAAGWLVEHPSNDPDVVRDNRGLRSLTPTTNSTRVSEGMGREGGAACLRPHMEVGKPIPEASRAGAGASAGRITSTQAVSSPPALGLYPPFMAGSGHGGSRCKVAVCQKRGAGTLF